jgi:hypothetical protein
LVVGFLLGAASNLLWGVGIVIAILDFMFFAVATAIGILRYRLYDIDLIVNRTLVYATLTITLTLIYFGGVTATQAIFRTLTSQRELPQLVVVGSTLVIAALFNPLRRRIQSFIDRSFYRRKYDARKTLEGFSEKLRDETDLEALRGDLMGVVRRRCSPPTSRCGYAQRWPRRVSRRTSSGLFTRVGGMSIWEVRERTTTDPSRYGRDLCRSCEEIVSSPWSESSGSGREGGSGCASS